MPSATNSKTSAKRTKRVSSAPKAKGASSTKRAPEPSASSDALPADIPANRDEAGRFIPGVSGNPNGRPKKLPLTDVIRQKLELAAKGESVTNAEKIADKLIDMALAGNLEAMKELADRAEGKPKQRSEISGPDGGPIPLPVSRNEIERRIAELTIKAKGEQ